MTVGSPPAKGELRRVVVVGSSCSGKTTLAVHLAQVLVAPHIELDAIYWLPNWVERPADDFRELTRVAVDPNCWVVDGNYNQVRDIVWSRATCVIWLNYSFRLVFWRALWRTIGRSISRRTLYSGNKESLRKAFLSRDSILWWVITTFRSRRRRYRVVFDNPEFPCLVMIEFRKQQDTDEFLHRLMAS